MKAALMSVYKTPSISIPAQLPRTFLFEQHLYFPSCKFIRAPGNHLKRTPNRLEAN